MFGFVWWLRLWRKFGIDVGSEVCVVLTLKSCVANDIALILGMMMVSRIANCLVLVLGMEMKSHSSNCLVRKQNMPIYIEMGLVWDSTIGTTRHSGLGECSELCSSLKQNMANLLVPKMGTAIDIVEQRCLLSQIQNPKVHIVDLECRASIHTRTGSESSKVERGMEIDILEKQDLDSL